jgi:hypothetical protein
LKILSVLGFSKAASKSALHASSRTMYAYLADVFIIEQFRGRSLATWLMECIVSHPSLQGLRRWQRAMRTGSTQNMALRLCSLQCAGWSATIRMFI